MSDTYGDRLRRKIGLLYPGAEILAVFPILWDGWELDNRAAVIRDGGKVKLITTDHGAVTEREAEWLLYKCQEYLDARRKTLDALMLLPAHNGVSGPPGN